MAITKRQSKALTHLITSYAHAQYLQGIAEAEGIGYEQSTEVQKLRYKDLTDYIAQITGKE